ncbi:hypothetical protein ABDK56_02090 [Sphingomonas sp. ASV193]|uniref:DUF6975 family protein n=1 Tax=Sphingomonas sp. ASV193 TaxID=3144405 RepID=UPI0032E8F631
MANAIEGQSARAVDVQLARVAVEGASAHDWRQSLESRQGPTLARDLADAVHLLCQLHGRHPGLIQLAHDYAPAGAARDWLGDAGAMFERERLFLVRLTAAAGPLPSTPGAAETESAMVAQRHAIETLARSERSGVALGACAALIGDWPSARALLNRVAGRAGMEIPAAMLPDRLDLAAALDAGVRGLAAERALAFGVEQLLLQHRALFDLLEARAQARGED